MQTIHSNRSTTYHLQWH